jgi:hypothetical protein
MYRTQFLDVMRQFSEKQVAAMKNLEVYIFMTPHLDHDGLCLGFGLGFDLALPYIIEETV